jgi:hypothetical protein
LEASVCPLSGSVSWRCVGWMCASSAARVRLRGLREHAPTEQHGDLLGVDRVVLRRAPMDGVHRQGVAQDTRQPFLGTQVGEPVPRQETCDGDANMVPIGRKGLEHGIGTGWHIPVHKDFPILVQNTEGHGTSVQVDTTIKWVLLGVEAHEVSSSCE